MPNHFKLFCQTLTLALSILNYGCVTVDAEAEAESVDPVSAAESRIALGIAYMERGHYLRARQDFEKALELAPDYYRTHLSMAHFHQVVGELDLAEDTYNKALKRYPNNGNVYHNYGTFLCIQNRYDLADQKFHLAIRQPSYFNKADSYENAGLCALKAGQDSKAKGYLEKALAHDPFKPNATIQLAALEFGAGNYTSARVRLMTFHQRYGDQKPSLKLLIAIEQQSSNVVMASHYQQQLNLLEASK